MDYAVVFLTIRFMVGETKQNNKAKQTLVEIEATLAKTKVNQKKSV
jgi:hypothetical protein